MAATSPAMTQPSVEIVDAGRLSIAFTAGQHHRDRTLTGPLLRDPSYPGHEHPHVDWLAKTSYRTDRLRAFVDVGAITKHDQRHEYERVLCGMA